MVDYLALTNGVVITFPESGEKTASSSSLLPTLSARSLPTENGWFGLAPPGHSSNFQFSKNPEMPHVPWAA